MNNVIKLFATFALGSAVVLSTSAIADAKNRMYEVTITNISKGEIFTPILVATHKRHVKLFELGQAASTELEILAEQGNNTPLADALLSSGNALDVSSASGVLAPGKSITLSVKMNNTNPYISVVSMLVPSNDAFFAVNGIHGPAGKRTLISYSPAYDAGSEVNDELCANIPGPPFICNGEGYNAAAGEGYVYIHPGIQGNGDLNKSRHDWRNPVARIAVRLIKK